MIPKASGEIGRDRRCATEMDAIELNRENFYQEYHRIRAEQMMTGNLTKETASSNIRLYVSLTFTTRRD